tara:strand:+ start:997 stop:1311 length:315 start_codon:yes stop_codon:yes gene_type:complete
MKWFLALALILFSWSAQAHVGSCYSTEKLEDLLTDQYGEKVFGSGVFRGQLYTFWHHDDGNFSVIITHPDRGVSCYILIGERLVITKIIGPKTRKTEDGGKNSR